ncbi:MAG TPA: hypothetical protein PKA12_13110, partial [Saprospiraceae bacterium]|nr:hypothetical protein [Saprospiraceae bacterium]
MKRILHGLTAPFLLAVFLFVLPSAKVNAQGCMTVGSFDQSGGGTLLIEVVTTTPCTGHDQLQVTPGGAILGGVLDIDTLTGFVKPNTAAGNDYVVLTAAGGVSGTFASTAFP